MTVTCKRCGAVVEALAQPPIPGALGTEIHGNVCPECWHAWLQTQVMLINEYRLSLIDPQARALLEGQMRAFLNLGSERTE